MSATTLAHVAGGAVAVVLVANLLVLVHELGHLLAARAFGVPVRRFAVGFGPVLLRRAYRRGTEWTLGLLPLSGWIACCGGDEGVGDAAYDRRGPAARALVVAARPAANALAAEGPPAGPCRSGRAPRRSACPWACSSRCWC